MVLGIGELRCGHALPCLFTSLHCRSPHPALYSAGPPLSLGLPSLTASHSDRHLVPRRLRGPSSPGASRPAVRSSPPGLTGAAVAARELPALVPRPQPSPPPPHTSASFASYVGPPLAAAPALCHARAHAARPPNVSLFAPRSVRSQVTFGELYLAPPVDPELALAARRARAGGARAARDLRGSLPSLLEEEAALLAALDGANEQPCAPFLLARLTLALVASVLVHSELPLSHG